MPQNTTTDQRASMRRDTLLAFERLLDQHAYKDIAVTDICREAHISKPTFYRCFEGKDYVVHWLTKEIIKCGIAEIGRRYSWLEGISNSVAALYRYRVFYSNTKNLAFAISIISNSSVFLKGIFVETLIDYKDVELTEMLVYQIDAFSYSFGHITKQWCEEGARVAPQRIATYLTSAVPRDLFILLNEPTPLVD